MQLFALAGFLHKLIDINLLKLFLLSGRQPKKLNFIFSLNACLFSLKERDQRKAEDTSATTLS